MCGVFHSPVCGVLDNTPVLALGTVNVTVPQIIILLYSVVLRTELK